LLVDPFLFFSFFFLLEPHLSRAVFGFGGFAPRGTKEALLVMAPYFRNGDIPLELVEPYLKHLFERTSIEPKESLKDPKKSLMNICMDLARYHDNHLAGLAIQVFLHPISPPLLDQ